MPYKRVRFPLLPYNGEEGLDRSGLGSYQQCWPPMVEETLPESLFLKEKTMKVRLFCPNSLFSVRWKPHKAAFFFKWALHRSQIGFTFGAYHRAEGAAFTAFLGYIYQTTVDGWYFFPLHGFWLLGKFFNLRRKQ